jgi:hypothetical protein
MSPLMPLMTGDQHSPSVLGCYSTNAMSRLLSSSAEWVFIVSMIEVMIHIIKACVPVSR